MSGYHVEARLRAHFWVQAHIRKCDVAGVPVFVLHRGDETAGSILLIVNRLDRTVDLFAQITNMEGRLVWMRPLGPGVVAEDEANAYVSKVRSRDPDLWVIELEDPSGRHFLTEPIEEGPQGL